MSLGNLVSSGPKPFPIPLAFIEFTPGWVGWNLTYFGFLNYNPPII